jgi:hypothetical protein
MAVRQLDATPDTPAPARSTLAEPLLDADAAARTAGGKTKLDL